MAHNSKKIAVTFAVAAAFCWGISTVMSKGALSVFSPILLLIIQLTASVLFLWVAIALLKIKGASWRETIKFGSLGILEPCIAYLLGLMGLAHIEASSATLIQSTEAIMIIMLSVLLFKNRAGWLFYALSVVALIGVIIVLDIAPNSQNQFSDAGLTGGILVFLGTACAAFYVVLSGRFVFQTNPIVIVAWQQTVALILMMFFLVPELTNADFIPSQIDARMWVLAITSGVIQYAIAFSLYLTAMKTINTFLVGNMLNMVPIFGIVGAFLFLGERFTFIQLSGAVITISAIILIGRLNAGDPVLQNKI